jgi:hypothetical protein
VTIAVYMSSPYNLAPETKDYEIGPEHAIFLLEPRLQILRAREAHTWTGDLIRMSTGSESENGKLLFGKEGGNGLVVDFETGVAVMRGGNSRDED